MSEDRAQEPGFEQQLEATLKAVTPSTAATRFFGDTTGHADGANAGFRREGAVLAIVFHTGPYRGAEQWDRDRRAPFAAQAIALTSILGWLAVIACAVAMR